MTDNTSGMKFIPWKVGRNFLELLAGCVAGAGFYMSCPLRLFLFLLTQFKPRYRIKHAYKQEDLRKKFCQAGRLGAGRWHDSGRAVGGGQESGQGTVAEKEKIGGAVWKDIRDNQ